MMSFGYTPEWSEGSVKPPIFQTSTFVFKKFDLDKFFKAKISGADLKESKPNPEIFIKAAKLSGFSKSECIVIEDSTNGIIAAKSAAIYCIGFNSPNSKNQIYDKADLVVSNFNEIMFGKISEKL